MPEPNHSQVSDRERERVFAELVAGLRTLYQEKTESPHSYGTTTFKLQWKGGVLSLITITDESTIRPHIASRITPPDGID